MQVVMWLVFAGSLCLARALSHERHRNGANLVRTGVLEVIVPDDFKVDSSGPDKDLLAHDMLRDRRLRVQSVPLTDSEQWISGRSEEQVPVSFRNLQITGVLDVRRGISRSDEGDAVLWRLRAWAAVPKIKKLVVITLDVGPDEGDADREMIEDIATGISVAKDAPPSTPTRTPIDTDGG